MKKVLAIVALAAVFAACNNESTTDAKTDSVAATIDSSAAAAKDSVGAAIDSSAAAAKDSLKK